eukprot:s5162_g2.t1
MASAFMPGGGRGSMRQLLRGGDVETGPAGREVLQALLRSKATVIGEHAASTTTFNHHAALTSLLRTKQANPFVAVSQGAVQSGDICDEEDFNTESKGTTIDGSAPGQVIKAQLGGPQAFPPIPPPLEWYHSIGKENEGEIVHAGGHHRKPGLHNPAGQFTNVEHEGTLGLSSSVRGTTPRKAPWWSQIMKNPDPIIYGEGTHDGSAEELEFSKEPMVTAGGTMARQKLASESLTERPPPVLLQPTPKRRGNAKRKMIWGAKARWRGNQLFLRKKKKPGGRKDLPLKVGAFTTRSKPSLARAIGLARQISSAKGIIQRVENDFYSNSSRSAKDAKRRAVRNVLEAAFEHPYPLTPDKMKLLAGAFREAGYKSADTYLVEAKTEHIEQGGEWSALLDRHFKLCIKAVKRGQGPKKKAPEVPRDVWTSYDLLATDLEGTKVKLAPQLFAFGVLFMMREIEIANLTIADINLSQEDRLVKVTWTESKMDQEGLSISRTLQCICQGGCDISCPYAVSEVLVNAAMLRGSDGTISVDTEGRTAAKADLVKDWKHLFNIPVTGHSTRRTGALQYIRLGWSVPQVGFLGRWKSNVILSYAEEALESMAVNTPGKFGAPPEGPPKEPPGTLKELLVNTKASKGKESGQEAIVAQIKADILALKKGTKVLNEEFQDSVALLKQKIETGHKYLPKFVTSMRYKVTHINHRVLLYAPAAHWRTICGWHYYNAGYHFEGDEGTPVTCTKCLGIAQSKEADVATLFTDQGQV